MYKLFAEGETVFQYDDFSVPYEVMRENIGHVTINCKINKGLVRNIYKHDLCYIAKLYKKGLGVNYFQMFTVKNQKYMLHSKTLYRIDKNCVTDVGFNAPKEILDALAGKEKIVLGEKYAAEPMVGMLVRGLDNPYSITNYKMYVGRIERINDHTIYIRILDHESKSHIGDYHPVEWKSFGKPNFEVLELRW